MSSLSVPFEELTLQRLGPVNRTLQVVEQLTHSILSGELRDEALLPSERVLAEKLGVSRPVVREATQILQSRGLLSIKHGVGTAVTRRSSEPVQRAFAHALHGQEGRDVLLKLIEVRFLVEVEMAALAAQRATEADLTQLRALLDEMEAAMDEPERYVELDIAFHGALAQATGNEVFALVLEASTQLSRQVRLESLARSENTLGAQAKHRAIFEAVAHRNAQVAAQQMREHLQALEDSLVKDVAR